MPSVVLFGAGSPIIVEVEESCVRRGWSITAGVKNVAGPVYSGLPSLGVGSEGTALTGRPVMIPLFTPANRRHAWGHAASFGAREFPVLADPTSVLPRRIDIAEGTYINAGCAIGAASRIGRFAFINRGVSLGHHLDLGEFASVGPGVVVAGQVTIGPEILIGAGAVVGAGTVVTGDVPAGAVVMGKAAV